MPAATVPLYVGLISGTSMDGVDAALVSLAPGSCRVEAALNRPYDATLRQQLQDAVRDPEACHLDTLGQLDHRVGVAFRDAALALLNDNGTDPAGVAAIGSHGQTVRHQPRAPEPFTLQIGNPAIIAAGTGITTVADFRRADLAEGGEGAPLAPAFHDWLWRDTETPRAVMNIGGYANLTVLPAGGEAVCGFDTGPGNALLDSWCRRHFNMPYDDNGAWAASGQVNEQLLSQMLRDDYFGRPPPKSTGFEYFNAAWLDGHLAVAGSLPPADVQATLCELTAATIADAVAATAADTRDLLVCGGGAHNASLLDRVRARLPDARVRSTEVLGIGPDWVEAATFAWLASRCLARETGNLPSVTGARRAVILGCIYPGRG